MTELLEKAVETLRQLPADEQDHIARAILRLVEEGFDHIESEHLPYVLHSMVQAERGEFAKISASKVLAAAIRRHAR